MNDKKNIDQKSTKLTDNTDQKMPVQKKWVKGSHRNGKPPKIKWI